MSNQAKTPLHLAVCGSTHRTLQCAQALHQDSRFTLDWVVTPPPKPVGRKQVITPNPLDEWAKSNHITTHHIDRSLTEIKDKLLNAPTPDYLLVVDFGYLVPQWLLELPHIAPINIHPSDLPKYRGSSPAQFALLYGETESAVTIMRMSEGMDEGPIIATLPFSISPDETSTSYYQKAFDLVAPNLAQTLVDYAQDQHETPQPSDSPAPVAGRLSRQDGYIPYHLFDIKQTSNTGGLSPILNEVLKRQSNTFLPQLIERAVRAFHPWPSVWTIVPSYKGKQNVRAKILAAHLDNNGQLIIDKVQYDGEKPQNTGLTT